MQYGACMKTCLVGKGQTAEEKESQELHGGCVSAGRKRFGVITDGGFWNQTDPVLNSASSC